MTMVTDNSKCFVPDRVPFLSSTLFRRKVGFHGDEAGPVPLSWKPLESRINSGEELPRDTAVKRQRVHDEPKTAKKRRQPVGDGEDIEAARKQYPGRMLPAKKAKVRNYILAVPTLQDLVNDENEDDTEAPLTSTIVADVSTPPPVISSPLNRLPTSQSNLYATPTASADLDYTGATREEELFTGAASV
ncbi:hypothetical protein FOZ63_027324 [Perkinsus olseni]|uniref:Uncharacterized protein n=1 Tax=Perkinsus olseni TaxID=32597 RepID=A0A7J6UII4_PEROL|nr:hypothetical protein FOZ62_025670 [Perkinsus olseni]KAF4757089.1 hypothetical protein FOZ63_027324 [Perkinsus olseni]